MKEEERRHKANKWEEELKAEAQKLVQRKR